MPKEQKPAAELSRTANQTLDQTRGAVDAYFDILKRTISSAPSGGTAAGVGAGYRVDRQKGQGRAETQDAERVHAGRLAMQIAVQPEHDANQGERRNALRPVLSASSVSITLPSEATLYHPNTRRFPPPWSVEELDAALPTFRPRGSLLSRKALTVSAHTPRVSRTA